MPHVTDGEEVRLWNRACHLVLDHSGRARLHDTRAALNGIALGLDIIRHELASPGPAANAPRVIDIMRRDLQAAAAELDGLQALVTVMASEDVCGLGPAVEWADTVARPVAERCGVELRVSTPSVMSGLPIDRRLGMVIALALVEGTLAGPLGGSCSLTVTREPAALVIEWKVAPRDQGGDPMSPRMLDWLLGPRTRVVEERDQRRLTIELPKAK